MKGKKLSDIVLGDPIRVLKIKDYAKIHQIYLLYLKGHYDGMSKEIFFYKQWEFMVDILVFLDMNLKSRLVKQFMFEDMMDEFLVREEHIKDELDLRKERKKYGL